MEIAALIVAGGQGMRAGSDRPKQLRYLGNLPVFAWSVRAFDQHPDISRIVLVVPEGHTDAYRCTSHTPWEIVTGGETRTASVRAGLRACALAETDLVLVHDAARPGLQSTTLDALIAAMAHADAAAPALPVADALKHKDASGQLRSVSRERLYRVQTPQIFRFGELQNALSQHDSLVDDLAAIEAQNGRIELIAGHETLAKITYPEDFDRMQKLLQAQPSAPRIGTGYDVHAFTSGTEVTLCGVTISHSAQLAGHSDADVGWHALTDAILGAAALGDIGDHFPPSDPQWKNADSALFLRRAIELIEAAGWQLSNCDLTLICEAPKIKPHRDAMRQRTSEITGLPLDAVSIKATTTEKLGFTGRSEGIAAQAAALLSPKLSTA